VVVEIQPINDFVHGLTPGSKSSAVQSGQPSDDPTGFVEYADRRVFQHGVKAYYGRWRPLRGKSDGIIFIYEKFQTDVITKCPC